MAANQDIQLGKAWGMEIRNMWRLGVNRQALAGPITLDLESPPMQVLNPGGAHRDVLLPPEEDSKGLTFVVINTAGAAENLVVKEDSDTTTIGTVAQNESAFFMCDGVQWHAV